MAPKDQPTRSRAPRLRAPLVGRKHELSMLEDALQETLGGNIPHTITIMGTPGVGKSRLVREFLADVRARDDRVRVITSHSREDGPAFGVIRGILRTRLGLMEGGDPAEVEETFRSAVSEVIGDRRVGEFLHFLGAFLDLQLPDSPLIQAMGNDPEQLRQLGRTVLRRFLELDAANQPLILALEDFQWAHQDSVDLLRYLIGSLRDVPLMFIIVSRPELLNRCPDWMEVGGNAMRFDLAPLDHEDASTMIEHLLANAGALPDELLDAAVDLAGGNPYLLEQIVRTFIEEGIVIPLEQGPWKLDLTRLDETQLPLSVDDAINARIASLDATDRALLEMAAAMGGVFWLGSLVALERIDNTPGAYWTEAKTDRERIRHDLDDLIERDYVLRMPDSAIPGDEEYAFKHNLERESLNRYTAKTTLSAYHLRIAQWLEFRLKEHTEEQCELLAHHYERGGSHTRAANYYLRAGDRAAQRYAAPQAVQYYESGLRLLDSTEAAARLSTLEQYALVLQLGGRSDEALTTLEEMRGLAYQLDLVRELGQAHAQIGQVHREVGHLDDAMRHLDTALALFEQAGDRHGVADSMDATAMVHALRGNVGAAEHLIGDAIEILQELDDERALARSQNNLGIIRRDAHRLDEALDAFQRALSLWRLLEDPRGVAESLTYMGVVQGQRGESDTANELWNEALSVARASGERVRQAVVLTCLGSAAYRSGDAQRSVELLEEAERIAATVGDRMQEADTLRSLAKARAHIGDLSGAHADVVRAISLFERAGSGPQLAVALRTLGEIAAAGDWEGKPPLDPAELFERSIGIFQETGNDPELARSYHAYADFLVHGAGESADGKERAVRASQLRQRASELLTGGAVQEVRTSRIPRLQ